MALQAVAGSKIYIGTRVAPKGEVALADFTAQETAWTEIGGWTQSGSLGDTREAVSQNFIGEARTRRIKGTKTGGSMDNTFAPLPSDPGQKKFKKAIDDCLPFAFKVEWGAGCASEDVVTISVGAPGVITWPDGHGLEAGSPVSFEGTGGSLPTGLTADTVYYVAAAGLTPTTFSVSATPGGPAIATTAAGSATSITATAMPAGETDLFFGLAMPGAKSGGEANAVLLRTWSILVDSNIVEV